jgi:hypothetical protein
MRFDSYAFGAITIDGVTYDHDVVLDGGLVSKRRKTSSKRFRAAYGHTPLSTEEPIPWECHRLVVGTGESGALPIMDEVIHEADRRGVEVVAVPTRQAIELLREATADTNAVLHVTC